MTDKQRVKTVVFAWYRKEDFLAFADGAADLDASYDRWRSAAQAAVNRHLAAGDAVELVSVVPQHFEDWLNERGRSDSPQSRLDYITELAAENTVTEACNSAHPARERHAGCH
jgi:hypothetical protein